MRTQTQIDTDLGKALVISALHYNAMDAETRALLIQLIVFQDIDQIGEGGAVNLLERLCYWAEKQEGMQWTRTSKR